MMDPINLPSPQEMAPGYHRQHRGSTLQIRPGKHGNGDLQVLINGKPISHELMDIAIMAIYMAEERYRQRGKKGGDYYLAHLDSIFYWIRSRLGKESNALYPRRDLERRSPRS